MVIFLIESIKTAFWYIPFTVRADLSQKISNVRDVPHYLKTVLAVVLFAKVRGVVMFESPRIRRVCGLSDFTKEAET